MPAIPILPGIMRITLPLPGKKPGPVHVYLFRGKHNVTLLDTGTFLSSRFLKSALADLGMHAKDLDRIAITHGHVDHCGAARALVRQSRNGIAVLAHQDDISAIQDGFDVPPQVYVRFLGYAGTPLLYRLAISAMLSAIQRLAQGCRVDQALHDGDHITLGDYAATVVATPGHTRGSICFFLEREGLLFSGDHILNHITPNALPMLEKELVLPLRQSQKEYYNSLDVIANLKPKVVHPAHGARIIDFDRIHHIYRQCFSQRQQLLMRIVAHQPPGSIYMFARKLFPNLNRRSYLLDLYLAVSETYSHFEVLAADGRIRMEMKEKVLRVSESK